MDNFMYRSSSPSCDCDYMEFTKENVIKALHMLSLGATKEADDYLHSFQQSNCAWFIAEDILSHVPHHEVPVLTFAAITFAKKIKQHINTLLGSELTALKETLTRHLVRASMIPESTPLVVQLGVCLSTLGLMSSNWDYELEDFVKHLSGKPKHIMALLEVLKVLPEETRPSNLPLTGTDLKCVFQELRLQSSYILNVLETILERPDLPEGCLSKCLAVCGSWTRFGLVLPEQVLDRKLFQRINIILVTPLDSAHLEAAECVDAMLDQSRTANKLDNRLNHLVFSLIPAFKRYGGDTKLLQNYCQIFVNLFKTHFHVTQNDLLKIQERMRTIQLLLLVAEHCPLELIETSITVWSLLTQDLHMVRLYRNDFTRLLELLLPRTALPASYESITRPDTMVTDRFRGLLSEVLVDLAPLVDVDAMEKLYDVVKNEQSPWNYVEVAIFFLRHLMVQFRERQPELILKILDSVKHRPQAFIRLQVLELISVPDTVDFVTIWRSLLNELRRDVPMVAAIESRLSLLMPHWNYFLILATMVDEFRLKESDRCHLLASMCALLRELPPPDVMKVKMYMVNVEWTSCPAHIWENRVKVFKDI
ncbi:importin-13 [Drosophila biarmipes]|uniref:importin-13 n=1 Tax=Drosophila biarmipes TaxID=125945 RepID=UPI001CDB002C|nr:importin-13 [Drosophila biarmipes]